MADRAGRPRWRRNIAVPRDVRIPPALTVPTTPTERTAANANGARGGRGETGSIFPCRSSPLTKRLASHEIGDRLDERTVGPRFAIVVPCESPPLQAYGWWIKEPLFNGEFRTSAANGGDDNVCMVEYARVLIRTWRAGLAHRWFRSRMCGSIPIRRQTHPLIYPSEVSLGNIPSFLTLANAGRFR